jgi:hypothetical protein
VRFPEMKELLVRKRAVVVVPVHYNSQFLDSTVNNRN